jgi:hypothetical protein
MQPNINEHKMDGADTDTADRGQEEKAEKCSDRIGIAQLRHYSGYGEAKIQTPPSNTSSTLDNHTQWVASNVDKE